jgi:anti-sigma B factor antagonist
MQVLLEQSADVRIVRVKEARLTYPVLSSFLSAVREVVEDGARKLIIDLAAVAYIDSAAIGCLAGIIRLVKERNGALKLSGVQRRVEALLVMTGLHTVVDIYHEEAEALTAFGRPSKLLRVRQAVR